MWQAYLTDSADFKDHEPCTTRAEADSVCQRLGWTVVEAIDAPAGLWGVEVRPQDEKRLNAGRDVRRSVARADGTIELP